MKQSSRLKRLSRHQKRRKAAGLNLVSLMDIFTILVFFLLINSGDVEILKTDDSLELPSSISEQKPEEGTSLLMVNRDAIILDGRPLGALADLALDENGEIAVLAEELAYLSSRKSELSEREQEHGLAITIMGDKDTPYSLLKSLIKTCTAHNYRDIALAVNQVSSGAEEGEISPSETANLALNI